MNNENIYVQSLLESSNSLSESGVDKALSSLTESELRILCEEKVKTTLTFYKDIGPYIDDLVANIQSGGNFKSSKIPELCKDTFNGAAFEQFHQVAKMLKNGYIGTQLKGIKDKHAHVELIKKLENLDNKLSFLLREIENKDSECVKYAGGQAYLDDFISESPNDNSTPSSGEGDK